MRPYNAKSFPSLRLYIMPLKALEFYHIDGLLELGIIMDRSYS